jgi:hypothetical protein
MAPPPPPPRPDPVPPQGATPSIRTPAARPKPTSRPPSDRRRNRPQWPTPRATPPPPPPPRTTTATRPPPGGTPPAGPPRGDRPAICRAGQPRRPRRTARRRCSAPPSPRRLRVGRHRHGGQGCRSAQPSRSAGGPSYPPARRAGRRAPRSAPKTGGRGVPGRAGGGSSEESAGRPRPAGRRPQTVACCGPAGPTHAPGSDELLTTCCGRPT